MQHAFVESEQSNGIGDSSPVGHIHGFDVIQIVSHVARRRVVRNLIRREEIPAHIQVAVLGGQIGSFDARRDGVDDRCRAVVVRCQCRCIIEKQKVHVVDRASSGRLSDVGCSGRGDGRDRHGCSLRRIEIRQVSGFTGSAATQVICLLFHGQMLSGNMNFKTARAWYRQNRMPVVFGGRGN